ncbi:MAG: ArsR/SmtB family transcription factor [Candidatus Bathyarchaeia archaeon]|jgi:predicted transcriptional regulator
MSEPSQIDFMLKIVENPVRRKIIKRLSQEPSYALELAKEIREAQQLVTAHLALMEREGFVGSSTEASPIGPRRKLYFLKQSAYLTVSFGPHLYNEQLLTFETLPPEISKDATEFLERINKIQLTKRTKIEPLSNLLSDIDEKLSRLEDEKRVLLCIRNLTMQHASEELEIQEKTHNEKRVLHFIMDERSTDIEDIAEALNLQESTIRMLLAKLKNDLPQT